jgi:hypothetical protein
MDTEPTNQDSVETLLKKILIAVSESGGSDVFTTLQTNTLNFGGTTSSFPALKYTGTTIKARLADDSDFCNIQGKIQSHDVAYLQVPEGYFYLIMYDADGTPWKVPVNEYP